MYLGRTRWAHDDLTGQLKIWPQVKYKVKCMLYVIWSATTRRIQRCQWFYVILALSLVVCRTMYDPDDWKKCISRSTLIINSPGQPSLWLRCLNKIKRLSTTSFFSSAFARSNDTHDDLFHKVTHHWGGRSGQVRLGQVNTCYDSYICIIVF